MLEETDVFLCAPPIIAVAGFWLSLCALGCGCKNVLIPSPDADAILQAIAKYKVCTVVGHFACVNTVKPATTYHEKRSRAIITPGAALI